MPEFLIFPPHIRQAQAALVGAGFPVEKDGPAFAALMFATIAWERTPHVSLAHQMQERLTAAERENRRLAAELLREGARADHLKGRLRRYEVVSTEVDYTTGPVPTYEEFYAAHLASGGGCIPTREMWASVGETCQRQLLAAAQQMALEQAA